MDTAWHYSTPFTNARASQQLWEHGEIVRFSQKEKIGEGKVVVVVVCTLMHGWE